MSDKHEKVVSTELPTDVDFTGTKYDVDCVWVEVGDEITIDDDEEILHTELKEDERRNFLAVWTLRKRGRTAFVTPDDE